MKRLATSFAIIAAVATASAAHVSPAQAQQQSVSLSKAAAQLGYTYGYLGPEDAVSLARPGVTIVIRPGERVFDVNDRTEAVSGPVPRFANDDVYVSQAMFRRLRAIAEHFAAMNAPAKSTVAESEGPPAPLSGAIAHLVVAQVPGQQLLAVSGNAPAGAPVTLTLSAVFSNEIQTVVLSRTIATADGNGTFGATVPVAPGYFRGAVLTIAASSVPGVTPASAHLSLKPVNNGVVVPADQDPKGVR